MHVNTPTHRSYTCLFRIGIHEEVNEEEGYLNSEAAGRYICVSRRRIHELTSAGLLAPDGYDGRTPLYRRRTLEEYVTKAEGRP